MPPLIWLARLDYPKYETTIDASAMIGTGDYMNLIKSKRKFTEIKLNKPPGTEANRLRAKAI